MTLTTHESLTAVSYSPNRLSLASGGLDGTVRIWDMRTAEEITSLQQDKYPVHFIAFTLNSGSLIFKCLIGNFYIWNFSDVQASPQQLYDRDEIGWPYALSPDSSLLASAQGGHVIRLWKTTARQQLAVLSGHRGEVRAISFSADGKILASGSLDSTIILWNSGTGEQIRQMTDSRNKIVRSLSFSRDGAKLASTSGDDILIWDLHTGAITVALRGYQGTVLSIQFSPDGKSLVSTARPLTLLLWNLRDDAAEASSIVLDRSTHAAAFSPDGLYIASVSSSSNIYIWDAGNSQETASQPLTTQHDTVTSVAISPDGSFIALGLRSEAVAVWDTRTGQQRFQPLIGDSRVMAISPNGQLLALGLNLLSTVRLYNAMTGVMVRDLNHEPNGSIRAVAFGPDTLWTAADTSFGNVVRLWTTATGQLSKTVPLFLNLKVDTFTFTPNGRLLAAGDHHGYIHVWQIETRQPAYKPLKTGTHRENSLRISFSPTSAHIVSGGYDKVGNVWDLSSGQRTLVLSGHTTTIQSIAYSPNGQFIVIGALDSTFRMWSAETGILLATASTHAYLAAATFTLGGQCIMVSCFRDKIRVGNFKAASLPLSSDDACDALAVLGSKGLSSDGWSLGPAGELLLWVPAEYRDYLQVFPRTMLIAQHRIVIKTDGSGSCAGENWTACWRG